MEIWNCGFKSPTLLEQNETHQSRQIFRNLREAGTWERGSYAEDGGETDEERREGPYGGRRVAQELVQTPPVRAWFWQALKRRASLTCGHTVRSNRNN